MLALLALVVFATALAVGGLVVCLIVAHILRKRFYE